MNRLYFDYNASAPLAHGLKDKILECIEIDYKNPSSTHQDGQKTKAVLEKSRKTVLQLLKATKRQLVFTSGGTESNNLVIDSAFKNKGDKNTVLATETEHTSVYSCVNDLSKKGINVVWIKVNSEGQIDLNDFNQKLNSDVFLVSVMLANNETGFLYPVKQMAEMAHQHNALFHTDAVCATGKLPVNVDDLDVDYYTFSSHKFGGLKGVGGLVYKNNTEVSPILKGGAHEFQKRAGTENIFGIVSTAFSLDESLKNLQEKIIRQQKLKGALKSGLQKIYPKTVFIESATNLHQTLNASFVGLDGNLLLTNLDLEGVSASYGSACLSGSLESSRVLRVIGCKKDVAGSAIRFSFGSLTTDDDINNLLFRLEKVISRMLK